LIDIFNWRSNLIKLLILQAIKTGGKKKEGDKGTSGGDEEDV